MFINRHPAHKAYQHKVLQGNDSPAEVKLVNVPYMYSLVSVFPRYVHVVAIHLVRFQICHSKEEEGRVQQVTCAVQPSMVPPPVSIYLHTHLVPH